MPVAVAYAAGAVLGSEFWIMGGSDDSGKKTNYIQVLISPTFYKQLLR